MGKHIAITGEGIVSAIGNDCRSVLEALQDNVSGIGRMQYLESSHKELPVGEVKMSDAEMREMLGLGETETSRTSLMAMVAIRQALAAAGLPEHPEAGHTLPRIVLISGTTVGGMDVTERHFSSILEEDKRPDCLLEHDCGSSTRQVGRYFGIFQDCTTISTACSSAANALILGAEMLKNGQADIVVAGGTESLSVFHLNGFNSLMILDHERCRPFDATRAGLNLGEGAAFVVLETEESAARRGRTPDAFLSGYANACDAFHQTASSENGEGAWLSMTQALDMAGLKPSDISYVNAHGTGTPNNDSSESAALQRVFGSCMPPVSSTKSFTGHTTSASGSIEAVICILAMKNRFIPGNLGWSCQMPEGITPTTGARDRELGHVLCNSFGFGGNDSSLVLSSSPAAGVREPVSLPGKVKVLSRVCITTEEELKGIGKYVKPLEARRMGKLMKASLLSSLQALEEAGITCPDAVVTGTALGCLENSEQLLLHLCREGENTVKPTYFMQSTHNTIGSNIAIRTGCHGYNITYTQGEESLDWVMKDAENLLRTGRARYVLAGCHDESTPLYNSLLERLGKAPLPPVRSIAMVLALE